jgi:hypothetical protein
MPLFEVLTELIGTANVRYPLDIHGVLREQRVMPYEEAVHYANTVLIGLRDAGYKIVKINGSGA